MHNVCSSHCFNVCQLSYKSLNYRAICQKRGMAYSQSWRFETKIGTEKFKKSATSDQGVVDEQFAWPTLVCNQPFLFIHALLSC